MAKVLLLHLDGKLPNLALMRISWKHRQAGDDVHMRIGGNAALGFWDHDWDKVYASAIFRQSIPSAEQVRRVSPKANLGGTGVDPARRGELVPLSTAIQTEPTDHAFGDGELDYSAYPQEQRSIGFTQRGCRLACDFCCVRVKEGEARSALTVGQIWRGAPYPKQLLLLDNDTFGHAQWRERFAEIRDGGFKVSFVQGINVRFLTDETAEAIASVNYRDDSMERKRIYTAWDNRKDEERLFVGLRRLVKYGVKPDHIMVYMLCGYWPGETAEDREYRRRRLREFGARPYPMPFVRTRELVGFQRFVIGAYDKRFSWAEFEAAGYRPEKLGVAGAVQ